MAKNKNPMSSEFIIFSSVLFLIILVVGSLAFFFSMRQIVRTNRTNELSQMLEIKRINLETYVMNEIAIVKKMAGSPLIKDYFADPTDARLKKQAIKEIAAYRAAFENKSIFWINDIDKIFYSNDNAPYVVDPNSPDNYWYSLTLYKTESYNFNINYNPDLDVINLWINAPVFDDNKKSLGMVGTGLELTAFVSALFSDLDDRIDLYYFNADGEVTGARDIELISSKKQIDDVAIGEKGGISAVAANWRIVNEKDIKQVSLKRKMGDANALSVLSAAKSLASGETKALAVPHGNLVVSTIPQLKWYAMVYMPDSINDYKTSMSALFFVVLIVILLIFIIFNVFVSDFLKSQHKAMVSLEHARNEAEIANRSKSNFLATMSHEIRTPMNAIIGIAQIQLQRKNLPEDYAVAFRRIYGSANSQLGIVNDILDMSKIETGKMGLNPVEYDTSNLINDAMQFNVVRIGEKLIEFIVDIDENLPSRLYGDELRIKQILNNLLSNAIKYTNEGCVKLSVGYLTDGDGVTLRFVVEDTGQGMKPQDKERLFSEYQRFNAEANRATEGTGLGLNITKRLVEMMDGTINVESEYGKGSVFTVTVRQKAVECPAIGADVAEQLRKFAFTGDRRVSNLRIDRELMPYGNVLVVDDVATNLYVAEGLLALYQLKVETVDNGFDVIERVRGGSVYDVIFMDHMMPRMDGMETMLKLREFGYTGAIVALTANALVGNDEMFIQKGFDGFISKPIDVNQLDETLKKFVRDKYSEKAKKPAAETVVKPAEPVSCAMSPKLLKFFCQDAEKAAATLRETTESGDTKLFTITAHAMKSALANVGEGEASRAAAALENAGKNGDTGYISAHIGEFIRTLESLIDKYGGADGVDESGKSVAAEDADYLIEQLRTIKSACDDYNDDAVYVAIDRLKKRRWKPSTAESLEKIREVLYVSSDFERAGELSMSLIGAYSGEIIL
jgi:signal transduction histidine kinase/CheY-like chemotaxis protein/HPt (histidine-containing phosphotransfer) domain-containing protein